MNVCVYARLLVCLSACLSVCRQLPWHQAHQLDVLALVLAVSFLVLLTLRSCLLLLYAIFLSVRKHCLSLRLARAQHRAHKPHASSAPNSNSASLSSDHTVSSNGTQIDRPVSVAVSLSVSLWRWLGWACRFDWLRRALRLSAFVSNSHPSSLVSDGTSGNTTSHSVDALSANNADSLPVAPSNGDAVRADDREDVIQMDHASEVDVDHGHDDDDDEDDDHHHDHHHDHHEVHDDHHQDAEEDGQLRPHPHPQHLHPLGLHPSDTCLSESPVAALAIASSPLSAVAASAGAGDSSVRPASPTPSPFTVSQSPAGAEGAGGARDGEAPGPTGGPTGGPTDAVQSGAEVTGPEGDAFATTCRGAGCGVTIA